MTRHIFFSWQSDTPGRVGKGFIEACLQRAIGELKADADVDPADRDPVTKETGGEDTASGELVIDRDTLDVPGSPPIMETIFGKIDRAAIFLSDLTYVAERIGGGRTPNPNVCIEHGYALKALGWRKMIAVMNTAAGHPDQHELPFDVRHTRRPIFFDLPNAADAEVKAQAREGLVRQLKVALRAILGDEASRGGLSAEAKAAEARAQQQAAETALDALVTDAHSGERPEIVSRPSVTLRLVPFAAARGLRLDPVRVAQVQLRFPPDVYEPVKTDSNGRQWWSCRLPAAVPHGPNPETRWRMRLVRPGYLEFEATIGARIDDDRSILIDGRHLEALIVRTLERMGSIAAELDLNGSALVLVSFDGIEDVHLTLPRPAGRPIKRPSLSLPVAIIDDLTRPMAEALHEQFDMMWQESGWPTGSPSFGQGAWAGYADTYNYPD